MQSTTIVPQPESQDVAGVGQQGVVPDVGQQIRRPSLVATVARASSSRYMLALLMLTLLGCQSFLVQQVRNKQPGLGGQQQLEQLESALSLAAQLLYQTTYLSITPGPLTLARQSQPERESLQQALQICQSRLRGLLTPLALGRE